MKKAILGLTLVSFLVSSCRPVAPAEEPFSLGQSRLPETPETGKNYFVRRLDERALPEPIRAATQPVLVATFIENDDVGVSSLESTTGQKGIVAVEDPLLEAVVPVVVLDVDQQPIEGVQVRYVHTGEYVTLSVFDPQGRFESRLIVAPVAELLAGAREADGNENPIDDLFSPPSAHAAPVKALPVVAALLVVLKAMAMAGFVADALVALDVDAGDVVASSAGVEYVCMTASEIESAQAGLISRLVLLFVRPARGLDPYRRIALAVGKVITPAVIKNTVASGEEDVVLFRKFLYPPEQLEAIYGGLPLYEPREYGELLVLEPAEEFNADTGEYAAVGRCVEPPDLLYKPITDARSELSQIGIPWREICTNEVGVQERYVFPGFDSLCPDGIVAEQSHTSDELVPILNEGELSTGSVALLPTFTLKVALDLTQLDPADAETETEVPFEVRACEGEGLTFVPGPLLFLPGDKVLTNADPTYLRAWPSYSSMATVGQVAGDAVGTAIRPDCATQAPEIWWLVDFGNDLSGYIDERVLSLVVSIEDLDSNFSDLAYFADRLSIAVEREDNRLLSQLIKDEVGWQALETDHFEVLNNVELMSYLEGNKSGDDQLNLDTSRRALQAAETAYGFLLPAGYVHHGPVFLLESESDESPSGAFLHIGFEGGSYYLGRIAEFYWHESSYGPFPQIEQTGSDNRDVESFAYALKEALEMADYKRLRSSASRPYFYSGPYDALHLAYGNRFEEVIPERMISPGQIRVDLSITQEQLESTYDKWVHGEGEHWIYSEGWQMTDFDTGIALLGIREEGTGYAWDSIVHTSPPFEAGPTTQTAPDSLPYEDGKSYQPIPGCLYSQLRIGDSSRLSLIPPYANIVRESPDRSALEVGRIQPGERAEILGGPICGVSGELWWQVRTLMNGLQGWTIEGDEEYFWLISESGR